jgi:hypothetical protein
MFELIIFYHGPLSEFVAKIDDREILHRSMHRYQCVAVGLARALTRKLQNVRWQIGVDGRVVQECPH